MSRLAKVCPTLRPGVWQLHFHTATDRIKDLVIAKIAMQAADLYADALSNMQVGSIKSMWDKVGLCGDLAFSFCTVINIFQD